MTNTDKKNEKNTNTEENAIFSPSNFVILFVMFLSFFLIFGEMCGSPPNKMEIGDISLEIIYKKKRQKNDKKKNDKKNDNQNLKEKETTKK